MLEMAITNQYTVTPIARVNSIKLYMLTIF